MFKPPIQAGFKIVLLAVLGVCPRPATGQSPGAVQHVSVTVAPIVVMAVVGEPRPFIIDTASGQSAISDATSFYNLTTNVDDVVISAEIDAPMPIGTLLFLSGESALGTSRGPVDISRATTARVLISSIGHGLENSRRLHYEFRLTDNPTDIPIQSRTVTLALLNPTTGIENRIAQTIVFGVDPVVLSTGDE